MSQNNTDDTCGCCEGVKKLTPNSIANPSGLSYLNYRVGTHNRFKASMITELSNSVILPPNCELLNLTTRADDDFSIALLDSWATVCDVLTFYQERIANEGFLRTSTERMSIIELARSIGYELRAGVAAEASLAFTIESAPGAVDTTTIDAGTKVQSLPIQGKNPPVMPQTYETIESITARPDFNDLKPKLTTQQVIDDSNVDHLRTITFTGTNTQLKVGDGLLIVNLAPLAFKTITDVTVDSVSQTTIITLLDEDKRLDNYLAQTFVGGADEFYAVPKKKEPNNPNNVNQINSDYIQTIFSEKLTYSQLRTSIAERGWSIKDFTKAANSIFRSLIQTSSTKVYAFRARAGFFGNNAQPWDTIPWNTSSDTITKNPYILSWDNVALINTDSQGNPNDNDKVVYLDNSYPKVLQNSWIVLRNKDVTSAYTIDGVFEATKADFMMAAKVTGLSIKVPETAPYVILYVQNEKYTKTDVSFTFSIFSVAGVGFSPNTNFSIDIAGTDDNGNSFLENLSVMTDNRGVIAMTAFPFNPELKNGATFVLNDGNHQRLMTYTLNYINTPIYLPVTPLSVFKLRETTAYIQSEELMLADILDTNSVNKTSIVLDKIVDGLEVDQLISITGELLNQPGTIISEVVSITNIAESEDGSHTEITFTGLENSFVPETININANVARATHGETKTEVLGSGDPSQPHLEFMLRQKPLTYIPASTPEGAQSTLMLSVDNIVWNEVGSLYNVGPKDHSFITRLDDYSQTHLFFGNARPSSGSENITAKYRVGIGTDGKVQAGQLSILLTRPLGVRSVTNPVDSSEGSDPEPRDQARKNAPIRILTLDRIVSIEDCESFALSFPGIGKAKALLASNGESKKVRLIVAGSNGNVVDPVSQTDLLDAIKNISDPFMHVSVESFVSKFFSITATVWASKDRNPSLVKQNIVNLLQSIFSFDNRQFGQGVALSEVIATIQQVDGVLGANINDLYLSAENEASNNFISSDISELLFLSPDPTEISVTVIST